MDEKFVIDLYRSIENGDYDKVIKLIRNKNLNFTFGNDTPLSLAIENGDEKMVKILVENGADVNYKTPIFATMTYTPYDDQYIEGVHEYIDEKYEEKINIFNYLIEKGADINKLDSGRSFLTSCVIEEYLYFMNLALDKGANINIIDEGEEDGSTPLMATIYNNDNNIFELLLERGADVNLQNKNGDTVLMMLINKKEYENVYLLHNEEIEMIKLLLQYGADVNIKNNKGESALDIAPPEIKKILKSKGKFQKYDLEIKHTELDLPSEEKEIKTFLNENCNEAISMTTLQPLEDHIKSGEDILIVKHNGKYKCFTRKEAEYMYDKGQDLYNNKISKELKGIISIFLEES